MVLLSFLEIFDENLTGSPQPNPARPSCTLPMTSLCFSMLIDWSTSAWAFHLCPLRTSTATLLTACSLDSFSSTASRSFSSLYPMLTDFCPSWRVAVNPCQAVCHLLLSAPPTQSVCWRAQKCTPYQDFGLAALPEVGLSLLLPRTLFYCSSPLSWSRDYGTLGWLSGCVAEGWGSGGGDLSLQGGRL